ncbi:MAG: phosphodiesterase [Dictyoglomus sp.]|nr:phosphodiesterase [Dictyoglomus sp.]MCX7942552.1 phosphodiesterase [Dictyoglomaceae bacterium]MDW8188790.1 phosphodiesterase [Dictyoglomus sp.]
MRILVMSDTHGDIYFWNYIEKYVKKSNMILHAGDVLYHGPRNPLPKEYSPAKLAEIMNSLNIPVIISKGNCDADVDQLVLNYPLLSPYSFIFLSHLKILLTHGENKNEEELWNILDNYKLDILIFGHIHTPVLKRKGNRILLNPGSPSLPKTPYRTIAFIENKEISIIDIEKDEVIQKETISQE